MRWLILILAVLVLFSCNKSESREKAPDCSGPQPTSFILDQGLVKAKFKTGTYWIFYDSITGIIDSNVIYQHSSGLTHPSFQCRDFEYWEFRIQKYSTSSGNEERYSMDARGISLNPLDFFFPTNIYFPPGGSDGSGVTHTRLDSIYIYNKYYKNVMTSTFNDDPIEPDNKAVYYFNTDYGFLRKDLYNSSNQLIKKRQLIRVNIVR